MGRFEIDMIIFIYGEDDFRSLARLREITEKFKADRDPFGYNISISDGGTVDVKEAMEKILAIPFLAEKKMVVLKNLLASKNENLKQILFKRICEEKIPESVILVFWEGEKGFKQKASAEFFSALKKEKFVYRFDRLLPMEVEKWVKERVEVLGGKISRQAVAALAENAGNDTRFLNSLIEQLFAYCCGRSDKEIQVKDVFLFVNKKADDNIFVLAENIAAGRIKDSFSRLREQYKMGKESAAVIGMIIRQFRILIILRDLFERTEMETSDVLAKKVGLHPFVVKKTLPLIKGIPLSTLKETYKRLMDLDYQTKTGLADRELLLDLFIGRMGS